MLVYGDSRSNTGYNGSVAGQSGVYGHHGDANPPIPYQGKVYVIRGNALIALSATGGARSLSLAAAAAVASPIATVPDAGVLQQRLATEVQKIVGAGHLRPAYVSHGYFNQHVQTQHGDYFGDYFHNTADTLLALAVSRPESLEALEQAGILSATQMERHGRDVVAAIQKALEVPASQLPRYPRQKQKTVPTVVSNRIQALRSWREAQARRLKIDPSLICSKATMGALAERRPLKAEDLADLNGLKQWQRKAFGKEILAALQKVR